MALATANLAPRIIVDDGDLLSPAYNERVIKILAIARWLLPLVLGIPQEHAEQMTSALLVLFTISATSMQDAQIVDKLDIALLSVNLGSKATRKSLDNV